MSVKDGINMRVLRVAVLSAFVLSFASSVWFLLLARGSVPMYIAHAVSITLTFLLIALYLFESAKIASFTAYRELRLRQTVDPDLGFVEYLPVGAPIFNACVGALARKGIYVRSADSMHSLAKLETVAVDGSLESREGYSITMSVLSEMGVELVGSAHSCPVKLILGSFDLETGPEFDFVLTHDKIAHILIAVYMSRIFAKYSKLSLILLVCALVVTAVLLIAGQFAYIGAAIALWSASVVLSVYRIERKTLRLTFKSVSNYK